MRIVVLTAALLLAACEQRPTRLDNAEANANGALREVIALRARVIELEDEKDDLEYRVQNLEIMLNQ